MECHEEGGQGPRGHGWSSEKGDGRVSSSPGPGGDECKGQVTFEEDVVAVEEEDGGMGGDGRRRVETSDAVQQKVIDPGVVEVCDAVVHAGDGAPPFAASDECGVVVEKKGRDEVCMGQDGEDTDE